MSEVAIRGLGSPIRRLSTHSSNSSKVNSSEKDFTEETLSIHSDESEIVVNEKEVAENVCYKMLSFVNSKKRESAVFFDSRSRSEKVARDSTKMVATIAEQVNEVYVSFLKSNPSRAGIISDGLKAGFDARKMLSPMVVKLKEKSDFIKEKVAENFYILSKDLADRTTRILELTKKLKHEEAELGILSDKLNSSKLDEVRNEGIKEKLSELEARQESFELPQPPRWVNFFGNWAVTIYSFFQNWAWERHGVGKQYREVTEELDRLNLLYGEFVSLNREHGCLKSDISGTKEELKENEDGFELLKANTNKLDHLLKNVINGFFTESIYKQFSEELEAAKNARVIKKPTIKDSHVDLKKSSVSISTNASEVDLRSSMIFESGVSSSKIPIDIYTKEFSNKIKADGTSKLEAVVEESSKMRKNAEEIFHAFSEVNRIFSSEYAKDVLAPKESELIRIADFQASSYQVFLNSVYTFAENVEAPARKIFDNNKVMEQATIEFRDSHDKLSKFDDIDRASTVLIKDEVEDKYSVLYRAMPPEFRKEYIKARYSEELKKYHGLPVDRFTTIVSKALNLTEFEISEVEASLKSEDKPVTILYSSSFINELESA